jgi:glycosyltransferase involved in cell wall biosynthesis
LLQAVQELQRDSIPFRIKIAGGGSLLDHFQRQAASLGITEHVDFSGHTVHMREFYDSIDVLVLPSLSEGMPLCVLEAMAMKRPVIATNVGGTTEAVRHEIDGLIVPPGDAHALAEAMRFMIVNRQAAGNMAESGCEQVRRRFNIDRVVKEIAALYDELLSGSTTSRNEFDLVDVV